MSQNVEGNKLNDDVKSQDELRRDAQTESGVWHRATKSDGCLGRMEKITSKIMNQANRVINYSSIAIDIWMFYSVHICLHKKGNL